MKLWQLMRPGDLPAGDHLRLHRDTDVRDVDCSGVGPEVETIGVTDAGGRVVGTIPVERIRFLAKAQAELDMHEILDHFTEAVVVTDETGRICYANQSYTEILGVPLAKILGRYLQKIEAGATLLEVLKTQRPIENPKNYLKSMNKYISVRIFPIFREGVFKGAYSIFRDITEINDLNNEVRRITTVAKEYADQIEAQKQLNDLAVVGSDPQFVKIISQALTVARTDATVLIRGENGVGKEAFTKIIHKNSLRKDKPFITVNCAAIPENLIESELFGHEEGSFTGAKKGGQIGKFQLAEGGTLFLDEIGDMPMLMQSKLLRVLQEGEIEKIGRGRNIPVNVRVIAATNQPLEDMISEGRFRRDLFYRLNVIAFIIPPLRQRRHDIVLLVNFFLSKYNQVYGKSVTLTPRAYAVLESYDWPGNIRELKNCIERAVILCPGKSVDCDELSIARAVAAPGDVPSPVAALPEYSSLSEAVKGFEMRVIKDALDKSDGNRQDARHRLGMSMRTFYRKLRDHGIT